MRLEVNLFIDEWRSAKQSDLIVINYQIRNSFERLPEGYRVEIIKRTLSGFIQHCPEEHLDNLAANDPCIQDLEYFKKMAEKVCRGKGISRGDEKFDEEHKGYLNFLADSTKSILERTLTIKNLHSGPSFDEIYQDAARVLVQKAEYCGANLIDLTSEARRRVYRIHIRKQSDKNNSLVYSRSLSDEELRKIGEAVANKMNWNK